MTLQAQPGVLTKKVYQVLVDWREHVTLRSGQNPQFNEAQEIRVWIIAKMRSVDRCWWQYLV